MGLQKIITKHIDDFNDFAGETQQAKLANGLSEIVENGKVVSENGVNTIWYKNKDEYYKVGLSKGFSGQGENEWVITAYKKDNITNVDSKIINKLFGGDTGSLSVPNTIKETRTLVSNHQDNSTTKTQRLQTQDIKFIDTKGKEHTLSKDTQEQWLQTFGLQNLEQSYIPKHSQEIQQALGGKEIRLQKGSLLKLVSQGREQYIPQIKEVLDNPEAIIRDSDDGFLFIRHLKNDDFFVNVSYDKGEYLVSISNGIKETRNLKNKLDIGGEIIYQSPSFSSSRNKLLQTSQYSANTIDGDIIPQMPKDNPQLMELQTKIQAVKQQIAQSPNPDKEYLHQVFKPDEIIELEKQYFNQAMPQEYKELMQDFPNLYEQDLANNLKAYVKDTDTIQEVSAQLLHDFKDKSFKDTAKHAQNLLFNTLRGKAQELGFKELDINAPSFKVAFGKFQAKLKRGDIQDLSEHIAINSLQYNRLRIQEALNIKPIKEFGTNYAEHYHSGESAIVKLLAERQGQVAGAFYRKELGDIDLVWGEVTGKGSQAKGYGLAKIVEKHKKEFTEFDGNTAESKLQNALITILNNGKIIDENGRKSIILQHGSKTYRLGLKQNWKGEPTKNKWIITAYEDREATKFIPSDDLTKGETLPLNSKEDSSTKNTKYTIRELKTPSDEELKQITQAYTQDNELFKQRKEIIQSYSNKIEKTKSKKIKQRLEDEWLEKLRQINRKIDDDYALFLRKNGVDTKAMDIKRQLEISERYAKPLFDLLEGFSDKELREYKVRYKNIDAYRDSYLDVGDKRFTEGKGLSISTLQKILLTKLNMSEYPKEIQYAYFDSPLFYHARWSKIETKPDSELIYLGGLSFDEMVMNRERKDLEYLFDIKPIKEFGVNYAEFYKDGKGAIHKLLTEAKDYEARKEAGNLSKEELEQGVYKGQVAGAFYKESLGDIDLVWGDSKMGLQKIITKHIDDFNDFAGETQQAKLANGLSEIIENGKVVGENGVNTIWYKRGDDYYLVGLSKGFNGIGENEWIITSYEKRDLTANQKADINSKIQDSDTKALSPVSEFNELQSLNSTIDSNPTTKGIIKQAKEQSLSVQETKEAIQDSTQTTQDLTNLKHKLENASDEEKGEIIKEAITEQNNKLLEEITKLQNVLEKKEFLPFEIDEKIKWLSTKSQFIGEDEESLKKVAISQLEFETKDKIKELQKVLKDNKIGLETLKEFLTKAKDPKIIENKTAYESVKATLQRLIEKNQKRALKILDNAIQERKLTYYLNTKDGEERGRKLFYSFKPDREQIELFEKVFPIAQKLGVEVKQAINDEFLSKQYAGLYYTDKNSVRIKNNRIHKEKGKVFLHELIHSVTSRAMIAYESGKRELLSPNQIVAINNIQKLYKEVHKNHKELGFETFESFFTGHKGDYGLKNSHEFVAELSNPIFREKLKKVGVFEKLVDNILRLFVSAKDVFLLKKNNAYESLKKNLYDIIDNYKQDFTNSYEKENIKGVNLEQSKELERAFLDSSGRVNYKKLIDNAEILPQKLDLKGFKAMIFQSESSKQLDANNAIVQTPTGKIQVNVLRAFNHYFKEGKQGNKKENRQVINATFMPTLLQPKFITKDKAGTLYFYKPFIGKNNQYHITSIAVKRNGSIDYTTSYNATDNRLKQMIKDNELVYMERDLS